MEVMKTSLYSLNLCSSSDKKLKSKKKKINKKNASEPVKLEVHEQRVTDDTYIKKTN